MGNVFRAFPALIERLEWTPTHLVHVGAHEGQEVPFYREAGITRITLVEPIPQLVAQLRIAYRRGDEVEVAACACGAEPGRARLHVMRRTNLSTLAPPATADRVAEVVEVDVRRLDQVAPDADAAVIDAQGRELDVLAAAPWATLRLVIVETCTIEDPTMASPYDDVLSLMASRGFREADRWVRDYDWINRWARGRGQRPRGGEVRDVVFVRADV